MTEQKFSWQDKKITIWQVRMIAVEAIRDATGCPDIVGRDGVSLVEKIEQLARKI